MNKYSPLKIAFSALAILLFLCLAVYLHSLTISTEGYIAGQNTESDILMPEPLPGDGMKLVEKDVPPPVIRQEGNVQGQTSIINSKKIWKPHSSSRMFLNFGSNIPIRMAGK